LLFSVYYPRFAKKKRKDTRSYETGGWEVIKLIVLTMIPIIIGQTFYQISAMFDDVIYGKMMVNASASAVKTSMGNYSSSYVLLTGVVMGVASSMSASLLPSVVGSYQRGDDDEICEKIGATIKANMFVAMPSFIGLVVLGGPIVSLLFPRYDSGQGGMMLKIGAIAVVFYTVSTVTSTSLQGINKLMIPVKHSCISLVVHLVIVWGLLEFTSLGIYAIVIGNATFPIIIMILNMISLRNYVGYRQEYFMTFMVPLACSLFMGVCVLLVYKLVFMISGLNIVALFFGFVTAALTYFGSMYMFRRFNINE